MTRKYAKVYTDIWNDNDFRSLSVGAQHLYLLLLSQNDRSWCGSLPLRTTRWSRMVADCDVERTERAVRELADERYVLVDWETEELLIRSFIRHDDAVRNPNLRKAIVRAIEQIESEALQAIARSELDKSAGQGPFEDPSTDPSEGCRPDPSEDLPRPNPQPSTINPQPSTRTSARTTQSYPQDDEKIRAVVQVIADTQTSNAKNLSNPTAYRNKCAKNAHQEHAQEIARLTTKYPTARPQQIAAYVLGEKRALATVPSIEESHR